MKSATLAVSISITLATVAGCGGGGGGSGGPSAIEVPFTSFTAITSNQTVVMTGSAATITGTQDSQGTVTSTGIPTIGPATARLSYDATRTLKSLNVSAPALSVSFDRNAPGHTLDCEGSVCEFLNPTAFGLAIDSPDVGWNYQSFGVWAVDQGPSWVAGAASVGAATAGNAIPTLGSANFTGAAVGFYSNASGTPFSTAAEMSATVDFSAQSIAFSTAETNLVNLNNGFTSTDTGLDLLGTFRYGAGVNGFSGVVNTRNGQLTGVGSGQFYGPAAQEIGGVYQLQGSSSVHRMIGAFGGRRPF